MESFNTEFFQHKFDEMRQILAAAWQKNLVAGFSGNASLRLEDGNILLTAGGVAKRRLEPEHLCVLSLAGRTLAGPRPSSEAAMHLAIYRTRPDCGAILHTHPPHLLALAIRPGQKPAQDFLDVPLFESAVFRQKLAFIPAHEPGSAELANAAAEACSAREIMAVWMQRHGLCCLGSNLAAAFALTEEYEHLARIRLLAGM